MARRLWLLFVMLLCASLAHAGERLALVIGNDRYAHFQPLAQAVGDARRVGDVLAGLPQPFTVTRENNVDRTGLVRALTAFRNQLSQRRGDVALVYYAGHAVSYANQVWLLPVDASVEVPEDIEAAGMPLETVAQKLQVPGWKAIVLVLDACRNQLFADGQAPKGIRGDALLRGLLPIPEVQGLLIAYATAPGQVAKEDTSTGGYYTSELLKHLRQPGLKLQEVFNDTALEVEKTTGQKPELRSTAIEPIYLAGQAPDAPGSGADAERQLWDESHCNSGDSPGCKAYLTSYPRGQYSALARERISTGAATKVEPRPIPIGVCRELSGLSALAREGAPEQEISESVQSFLKIKPFAIERSTKIPNRRYLYFLSSQSSTLSAALLNCMPSLGRGSLLDGGGSACDPSTRVRVSLDPAERRKVNGRYASTVLMTLAWADDPLFCADY